MNANSISHAANVPSPSQGASLATEFQFQQPSGTPIAVRLPAVKVQGRRFAVVAFGRIVSGATLNFTGAIYLGESATIGSNAVVFSSGAKAINSTSGSFMLRAEFFLDGDSRKLQGFGTGSVNNILVAAVATTERTIPSPLALINQDGTAYDATADGQAPCERQLAFTCTGTFSASNAANGAILDGFELEVL